MKHDTTAHLLVRAAERAKTRPSYLAWVLARYMEMEKVSEEALSKTLNLPIHQLPRLGLCLRPRQTYFTADIKQLSLRHRVDANALAKVVRLVDSILAMTTARTDSGEAGILMAARARREKRQKQDKKGSRDEHRKS